MGIFYSIVTISLLARGRFLRFKLIFLSLLLSLFLFEVFWIARVLDYVWIVGLLGL